MEKQVSLYLHIPFCLSKCDYCDFFSVVTNGCSLCDSQKNIPQCYVDSLCNEIDFRLHEYGSCNLLSVYIGGGTPSLLSGLQINKICETIEQCCSKYQIKMNDAFEFTFEVNPDDVTEELLTVLEAAKINRISCGVQSFSDTVLKNIHRRANSAQVNAAIALLTQKWKQKLSVDLICGLPFESKTSLMDGLKKLCKLKIPHISFYSLCVEEETPLGNAIINNKLEYDYDFCDELWITGRDYLIQNGYIQYEVSNFCLPGYECIHNMTYWTHKDYIGSGSGATGTLYKKDENGCTGFRWTNKKNLKEYINFWVNASPESKNTFAVAGEKIPQETEIIEGKTAQFEYFMMALRTNKGISKEVYKSIFGQEINPEVIEKLNQWCEIGRCVRDGNSYHFNSEGLLFLNKFLEELC